MNLRNLEAVCKRKFGVKASAIFGAMREIANIDFCVATGWNADEVSISRECTSRGVIFNFKDNYKTIVSPDGTEIKISEATHNDIANYLKRTRYEEGWTHCSVDAPNRQTNRRVI